MLPSLPLITYLFALSLPAPLLAVIWSPSAQRALQNGTTLLAALNNPDCTFPQRNAGWRWSDIVAAEPWALNPPTPANQSPLVVPDVVQGQMAGNDVLYHEVRITLPNPNPEQAPSLFKFRFNYTLGIIHGMSAYGRGSSRYKLSDFVFALYAKGCEDFGLNPIPAPKMYVSNDINNALSENLVTEILGVVPGGGPLNDLQHVDIKKDVANPLDQDGFKILVGMPVGSSKPYLLFQHREVFGLQTIGEIQVWPYAGVWNVVYKFEPYAKPAKSRTCCIVM